MSAFLEMDRISKSFGPVRVLDMVSLAVSRGEVRALVGENGAGKSTLMKILSGALQPDSGTMKLRGGLFRPSSPADARRGGIAMIYQELSLAPHLSVEQNIMMGRERSRFGFVIPSHTAARDALRWLGHGRMPLDAPVGALSVGERQVVEIARALAQEAGLVVMDEPTSSLSASDAERLFGVVRRLAARGVAVIYISHFLEEIRRVADSWTVLRDGRNVASGTVASSSIGEMVGAMIGRSLDRMFPRVPREMGAPALEVNGLSRLPFVRDVSFVVRTGEILGLAGLVGSGRTELLRLLFGLDRADSGSIRIFGGGPGCLAGWRPARALDYGMDMLSEDRKGEGLAQRLAVRENATLSSLGRFGGLGRVGFLDLGAEGSAVSEQCRRLGVRCRNTRQRVSELSGGNQQKVAVARVLMHGCRIVLLDEPTRGIDVGNKAEIYRLIGQWAAEGRAVLMTSSYLPELLGICDSIAVMHRGRMSQVRPAAEWTASRILAWAAAGDDSGVVEVSGD